MSKHRVEIKGNDRFEFSSFGLFFDVVLLHVSVAYISCYCFVPDSSDTSSTSSWTSSASNSRSSSRSSLHSNSSLNSSNSRSTSASSLSAYSSTQNGRRGHQGLKGKINIAENVTSSMRPSMPPDPLLNSLKLKLSSSNQSLNNSSSTNFVSVESINAQLYEMNLRKAKNEYDVNYAQAGLDEDNGSETDSTLLDYLNNSTAIEQQIIQQTLQAVYYCSKQWSILLHQIREQHSRDKYNSSLRQPTSTRYATVAGAYLSMTTGGSAIDGDSQENKQTMSVEDAVQQATLKKAENDAKIQAEKDRLAQIEQKQVELQNFAKESGQSVTIRLQEEALDLPVQPYKVGIIGCGRIGYQIVQSLIQHNNATSFQYRLTVSTRRLDDERIANLTKSGVVVCDDNARLLAESNFVILSCLPHQFSSVCSSFRTLTYSPQSTIFWALFSSIDVKGVKQGVKSEKVIKTKPVSLSFD